MHRSSKFRPVAQPRLTRLAAVITTSWFAALVAMPVQAQDAKKDDGDAANLNRVVVTATSQAKSKLRSSVSVTDIDQDFIKDYGAHSESEILQLIPGIRSDPAAGPGGNSNITVRGLPIASGGSKYVQLQEDGLPTVQFGDMNFANNDYWIRFDNNVDRIQTLRGGSSAVFASHAPGAVINFISKTGKDAGGSIGLSRGLNFNETRVDGDYGNSLGSGMYFHLGGYVRQGEGTHHTPQNTLEGYQLKGNLTKEFNGDKGYARLYFKIADEHAPTTFQTLLTAKQNGNTLGSFDVLPGYDARRDSQYSIYNSTMTSINPATRQVTTSSLLDGIKSKSNALGFELHNEMANGITVDDKFRISKISGAFTAPFWNVQSLDFMLNNFGSGAKTAKYFNGPLAGQTVTAGNLKTGLVSQQASINTTMPDMGNVVNDLSLNKQFKLDAATVDVRGGFYHMTQNVVQTWSISERVMEVGRNGALIDVYNAAGAALTTGGLTGYNNQWGACCARDIDAKFTTDAPYLSLNLATGPLDLDAGVRREQFRSDGHYSGPKQLPGGFDVNGDGVITGGERNVYVADVANPGLANYKISYTNYSLGANYRVNNDLSAFVRHSKGNRAISDRLFFSPNINSVTGLLVPGGGESAAVAPVKQSELGVKYRGKADFGNYGLAATYFHSTTTEFDYDQTRQDNPNLPNFQGPKLNVVGYKSDGVEFESAATMGNFGLNFNVVYSKESKTADLGNAGSVGKTSSGVPKWRYNISPRYSIGPLTVGATIRGQGKMFADGDNKISIDGHYIVNAFANYDIGGGVTASLNVGNVFDKIAPTGGGGFVGGSSSVVGIGVETGRIINASIRYAF